MGDRAILLEVASIDDVLALRAALEASRPDGVVDIVPAARTVLVRVDPRVLSLAAARSWAIGRRGRARTRGPRRRPRRSSSTSSTTAPISPRPPSCWGSRRPNSPSVTRRRAGPSRSRGSRPGFGYLVSADWPYDVPRLTSPRTRVPAGAVGLAAGFTGAYPRETPGRLAADRHDLGARCSIRMPRPRRCSRRARSVRFRPVRDGPRASRAPEPCASRAGRARHPRPRARAARDAAGSRHGRARHPSASRRREPSTAAPSARRTACSATPRAPRASRSRWADSARARTPTSGSR